MLPTPVPMIIPAPAARPGVQLSRPLCFVQDRNFVADLRLVAQFAKRRMPERLAAPDTKMTLRTLLGWHFL